MKKEMDMWDEYRDDCKDGFDGSFDEYVRFRKEVRIFMIVTAVSVIIAALGLIKLAYM